MKEINLERDRRLQLRAQAHHLDPVVLLGANGLTDAVTKEIDRMLTEHELIKVRVPSDDREEREEMYARIAEKLGCARVQMIGKLLIFWRPSDMKKPLDPNNDDDVLRILRQKSAAFNQKKTAKKKSTAAKPQTKKSTYAPKRRPRPKSKRVTKKAAMN